MLPRWRLTLLFLMFGAGKRRLLRFLLWLSWWFLPLLIVDGAYIWLLPLRIGVTLIRQAPTLPPLKTFYLHR